MYLRMFRSLLVGAVMLLAAQASYALQVGDKAPEFSLPSTSGTNVKLSDFAGKQSVVIFTYFAAYTKTWTQEALGFQLDLPKFEAVNAQVLGVSVDVNGANQAWAKTMGVTYPLLSDGPRTMLRAYQTLYDDPELVKGNRIGAYLRAKRSWYVIDKQGIVRYIKLDSSQLVPSDELIEVIKKYNQ